MSLVTSTKTLTGATGPKSVNFGVTWDPSSQENWYRSTAYAPTSQEDFNNVWGGIADTSQYQEAVNRINASNAFDTNLAAGDLNDPTKRLGVLSRELFSQFSGVPVTDGTAPAPGGGGGGALQRPGAEAAMRGLRMAGTAGGGVGEMTQTVGPGGGGALGKRIYPNEQSPLSGRRLY